MELTCHLGPLSKETATPKLFPLHVVEWVRLGFNIPILIKFGVYAPRVHPNYKGKKELCRCFLFEPGPFGPVDPALCEWTQETVSYQFAFDHHYGLVTGRNVSHTFHTV